MPKCTDDQVKFGRVGRRVVEAAFDGGDIASDGGVMLLRQVDRRLRLTHSAAAVLDDLRRLASAKQGLREMLDAYSGPSWPALRYMTPERVLRMNQLRRARGSAPFAVASWPPQGSTCANSKTHCVSNSKVISLTSK